MKNLKKTAFLLVLTAMLSITFSGCTKEGFDGDARVSGTVAHHGEKIADATVYIKFGASELPGTLASDFDASTIADAQGVYTFENLKRGNYYLYSLGYDSSIVDFVKGGISFELTEKDQDLTVDVAVTE